MKQTKRKKQRLLSLVTCLLFFSQLSVAQTDLDAIMMGRKQLCIGPGFSHSSWTNYWEGTLKRDNANLGTVSTQAYSLMGAYGVSSKLNILFNAPYVKTKASAGTLHGMKGVQDLGLFIKYMPVEAMIGEGTLSVYTIGGVSFPLSNYVADFLPLSIGLHSKTASLRLMLDYQRGSLFATGSATYVMRDNITIDRTAYYTTEMHYTNEVEMPNGANFNFRAGYRSEKLIAEAVVNSWKTLGGFDITRNNMPFPSNEMNATAIGVNCKYVVTADHKLSLVAGANTTVAGRNVGQATTIYGAVFYIVDFNHTKKDAKKASKKTAKTN